MTNRTDKTDLVAGVCLAGAAFAAMASGRKPGWLVAGFGLAVLGLSLTARSVQREGQADVYLDAARDVARRGGAAGLLQ